jgi:hypothetical protein
MASNFPTSLDNFSNPTTGDKLDSPSHAGQHGDANDAIEGLEIKLGIGASSAGSATAGFPLVHSSGGTTAWAQVGYQGITSGTATSGQVLTAGTATGSSIWSTPSVAGLTQIVPTSVSVGGTAATGSVSTTGTITFGTATSVSMNDVFSATYDNYTIILDINAVSASQDITLRLRTSGGADATTNYTNPIRVFDSDGGSGNFISTTSWKVMETRSGSNNHFYSVDMNLHSPFLAVPTTHTMTSISRASSGASKSAYGGGMHEDATSYSSLSILTNTGHITGKVSVYGFRL